MTRLLIGLGVLLFICAVSVRFLGGGRTTSPATTQAIAVADAEQFAAMIGRPDHVLIDVRTPVEHAAGHISTTDKLIDFESPDFKQKIAELPRDKTYLIYCRSGRRSGQAAATMNSLGFPNVINLDGGINAWQRADKPVVK